MTDRGGPDALADALTATALCAGDARLGGLLVRGASAEDQLRIVAALAGALPAGAPIRRLTSTIDDDRLLGGIDLGLALAGQGLVLRPGLLAEADGGLFVIGSAERLSTAAAARIAATLDAGAVTVERNGRAVTMPARLRIAAFSDGNGDVPAALVERLAFHLQGGLAGGTEDVSGMVADDQAMDVLARTAGALGVQSGRAPVLALRAARIRGDLAGRMMLDESDLAFAVRTVLAPRATRLPEAAPPAEQGKGEQASEAGDEGDGSSGEDRVLAAARAAIPADLLQRLAAGNGPSVGERARGIGAAHRGHARGRPLGARAGKPGGGKRLALVETLRAAVPWQRLRGRDGRVEVRVGDLRVRRYESRAEPVTIFTVDASGSAALARLAEAKGAVELLLGQAYVQRAQVALVAFRGEGAELLLPPTRSLARAKRALADLPGGGGTPLAAGLDVARAVAVAERGRGRTPFVVLLSDGRANVSSGGDRGGAAAEATAAARTLGGAKIGSLFIDTGLRPRAENAQLAGAMGAAYLPLPQADAVTLESAVRAHAPALA